MAEAGVAAVKHPVKTREEEPAIDEPAEPLATGPTVVLRKAAGLSATSILAALLAVPTMFLAARWLGAGDFGRAQFVVLLYSYAALLRTGAFEGSVRSYVHHRGTGDHETAVKHQNVGFSVELAASVVPGLVLAVAALASVDGVRTFGLLLAPVAVVAASAAAYLGGLHTARSNFAVVTRVNLLRAVCLPLLVLGGVVLIGAPAVFGGAVLADAVCVLAFVLFAPPLHLRWDFDRTAAWRLVRAGFPLGALAVVYWAYRLVGITCVAVAFPAAVLGLYTFAALPAGVVARAVAGLQTVIMPGFWGEMARPGRRWIAQGTRLTILMALVSGAAANLAQAGFAPFVHLVASRFSAAIPIFDVLAVNILLLSIATVPSLVLDSHHVNRQGRHLAIWVGGFLLNLAANGVAVATGHSALAVAWNDLWVQLLVVTVIFEAAAPYQRPEWHRRDLYPWLAGAIAVTGALSLLLHTWAAGDGTALELVLRLGMRVAVVGAVWGLVGVGVRYKVTAARVVRHKRLPGADNPSP